MSTSKAVAKHIRQYPELGIIDARQIHSNRFREVPETAFYQVVSRMAKAGEIERITKGIYCKPKLGKYGNIVSGEQEVMEYFLGDKKIQGVVIGYRLYNKYRLSTQVSKTIEVYSKVIDQDQKRVLNVHIKRVNLRFDLETVRMIEFLEILQNYALIEDLNKNNLCNYLEDTVESYDDKIVLKIIKNIKYKKSTLASLRSVLDYYEVENTIGSLLNATSKYSAIDMEALYESASIQ